ncbi:hypothetical protein RIF29_04790 [Crotalaria pallida]|uniref:Uncharacterized protein n=1 Tax=Crotalaria pallida TaxID=3830 RepID=A0AAN9J3V7_CROPI
MNSDGERRWLRKVVTMTGKGKSLWMPEQVKLLADGGGRGGDNLFEANMAMLQLVAVLMVVAATALFVYC